MKNKKWIFAGLITVLACVCMACGKVQTQLPANIGEHTVTSTTGEDSAGQSMNNANNDSDEESADDVTAVTDTDTETATGSDSDTANTGEATENEDGTANTDQNPDEENNTAQNTSPDGTGTGEDAENGSEASLEGKVLLLDPGHGGIFAGAVYDGRQEKDLVLQIAYGIKDYIEAQNTGLQIYMTREDDTIFSNDVAEDLQLRCQMAEEVGADVFVSLHLNATESHENSGAMVLISKNAAVTNACSLLGNDILDELELLGIKIRGTVMKDSNDTFDENGVAVDYYAINRHCAALGVPGIIVEHCFMDNTADIPFIENDDAIKALAEADAKGILAYFYSTIEQ